MRSRLPLVLLLLSLVSPAFASDGVLEINQTCAVATGCFAGDTAGFPVTITTPGTSYRLTSPLTVPNESTDGIVVSTSDVGIDLNNFAILGPVTCSGTPLVCTPAVGTGSGVERVSAANRGISVKNGSITGMGAFGVLLGEQAEVTNLRVRWNRSDGISIASGSTVSGNTAYSNGSDGIFASSGSTVSGNTAYSNGNDGIVTAGNGSTVSGNTAYDNGNDGIQCSVGCLIRGNTVRANASSGLNLSGDSAYSDNVVTLNTIGAVTGLGSANSRGGNYCAGTGTVSAFCP